METYNRLLSDILDVQHEVLDEIPWETEPDEEEIDIRFEAGILTVGREGHEACPRGVFERRDAGIDLGSLFDDAPAWRPCPGSATNAEVLRPIGESLRRGGPPSHRTRPTRRAFPIGETMADGPLCGDGSGR